MPDTKKKITVPATKVSQKRTRKNFEETHNEANSDENVKSLLKRRILVAQTQENIGAAGIGAKKSSIETP